MSSKQKLIKLGPWSALSTHCTSTTLFKLYSLKLKQLVFPEVYGVAFIFFLLTSWYKYFRGLASSDSSYRSLGLFLGLCM